MRQLVTEAIILRRTDYGEADRILTLLTPSYGKLTLLAKGVRKIKSKLAGGIELFSVSEITFIKGRGEIGTLVSTRLGKHYGHIVSDLNRSMMGYELIKRLNKITENETEPEYFDLLRDTFEALNDTNIFLDLVQIWFSIQLIRMGGYSPNLHTDGRGDKLAPGHTYNFSFENMTFEPMAGDNGTFNVSHIKFLRLAFAGNTANTLAHIQGSKELVEATASLVNTMITTFLRV